MDELYPRGMPSVTTRESGNAAVGTFYVLEDERAASRVEIAPARGAIVTSMRVGARDVLYMDESTLFDASKNVRGGIPVLFPAPGKSENDEWHEGTLVHPMKQHGFARNLPWQVLGTSTEHGAMVSLELAANQTTIAQFPWVFRLRLVFVLTGPALRIGSNVFNDSERELAFGLGYHPYFAVTDKAHVEVETRATRAFDNVTKRVVPFAGFDFTTKEVDLHLVDHGGTSSALHLPGGGQIDLVASHEFTRWVVWSLPAKPFVCVEPWTCPGNALNTGEQLLRLGPGSFRESWVEIRVH
jgi:galactose mutarotase-like enzyme